MSEEIKIVSNEWRDKINPIYFVPNKSKTKETDITKLKDSEKLVLLQGLKEVAALRGYDSVNFNVERCERDLVCVKCTIIWSPLVKDGILVENEKKFSSLADAHADNVEGMAQKFLTTTAENRAFSRCVRNFLRIDVVSESEIDRLGEEKSENSAPTKKSILIEAMEKKGKTFLDVSELLKSKGINVEKYKTIDDLSSGDILTVLAEIKRKTPRKAKESPAIQEIRE